jgi:hypothetical protein
MTGDGPTGVARVGCSGWMYKHWRGAIYPESLPAGAIVHDALERGGETALYGSLDDAMRAAQLPGAVNAHPSER